MNAQPFRVAILDDHEGLASSVPSFERLKARADVEVMQERLGSDEALGRALKEVNAVLLMRERTRFGDQQFSLLPALKLIA
ncbi:MAG: D-2-hydroxyacid dehydrogenase family protein, partial [Deltaproteobacteria bacterium]|nr:D-2-hydroxyacid dehydrogenase family protein [Deltaproteobacteria bacterium]